MQGSKFNVATDSWLDIPVDVATGLIGGCQRTFYIISIWLYDNIVQPIANPIFHISSTTGKHPKNSTGTIKVAAVGFGRTGTYSVKLALEELGFSTLHTAHMYEYENREILEMWSKFIFNPALEAKEIRLGQADLQLIAHSGFDAVADLPTALFYEQIYREYPDCKFILTTRDTSEIWYRSWQTMTKSLAPSFYFGGFIFPTVKHYSQYLRWLMAMVNNDVSYMSSILPKNDNIKENAIAFYENHNRRIREVIPPEQLLELNVKDGWGPLCKFLDIDDCPMKPFPKSNSANEMRAQSMSAGVCGMIIVFVIYTIVKLVRPKQGIKEKFF